MLSWGRRERGSYDFTSIKGSGASFRARSPIPVASCSPSDANSFPRFGIFNHIWPLRVIRIGWPLRADHQCPASVGFGRSVHAPTGSRAGFAGLVASISEVEGRPAAE